MEFAHVSQFTSKCLYRGRRPLLWRRLAMLLAFTPQSVVAALTFSGDVSLNTGIPTSPVMVGPDKQSARCNSITERRSLRDPVQFGITTTGIGTGIVTGARTTWNMPRTDVAFAGIGRLDIKQGAVVDTMRLTNRVAQRAPMGPLVLTATGSTLQVRGPLTHRQPRPGRRQSAVLRFRTEQ